MKNGIGDSFLFHLGFKRNDFYKVDLTYKGNYINNLGAIVKRKFLLDDIVSNLNQLNVKPNVIYNPKCKNSKIGYIPGGGFDNQMIIEMADQGVDVLISSDHNWVVETIARELDMTLIEIDHYSSERYGLNSMRKLLSTAFPNIPITILENLDGLECKFDDCNYCTD
jgi:putative NIF3 family GTP cyclohydrolase 1 type 2